MISFQDSSVCIYHSDTLQPIIKDQTGGASLLYWAKLSDFKATTDPHANQFLTLQALDNKAKPKQKS